MRDRDRSDWDLCTGEIVGEEQKEGATAVWMGWTDDGQDEEGGKWRMMPGGREEGGERTRGLWTLEGKRRQRTEAKTMERQREIFYFIYLLILSYQTSHDKMETSTVHLLYAKLGY